MKLRFSSALFLISLAFASQGQQFSRIWKDSLASSMTNIQMEWVALDQDTLLDIIMIGQMPDGELRILSYRNTGLGLLESNAMASGFASGYLQLADWNLDNKMDVLISGRTLTGSDAIFIFKNNGDFTFTKDDRSLLAHHGPFRLVDFNLDGRQDILAAGPGYPDGHIKIYSFLQDTLRLVFDSLNVSVQDIVTGDLNNDGLPDFVVSSVDPSGTATRLFSNRNNFKFRTTDLPSPVAGQLSITDQNADGKMDLFAAGLSAGSWILQEWNGDSTGLQLFRSWPAPVHPVLFTGDMNSDGIADHLVSGTDSLGKRLNYIQDWTLAKVLVDTAGLILQRAGDFDRDGDLDVLQVTDSAGRIWLKMLQNRIPARNRRPGNAAYSFAISSFNKTFLYWDSPSDDHTDTLSLTYDVWLGRNDATLLAAGFDLGTGRRMIVAQGNAGTIKSKVIQGLTDARYYYYIQTVDNAYNGSYCSSIVGGGSCSGYVQSCFDLVHEQVQACKKDNVEFRAGATAYWFSVSKGFLKKDSVFSFQAIQNDTIFSFMPMEGNCSNNKVWTLNVHGGPTAEQETLFACQGQAVTLGIAPGWKNVSWNAASGTQAVDTVSIIVKRDTVLVVTAYSASNASCPYRKEFDVRVSKPTLKLNGDVFKILKGNYAQLEAIGNADHFLWSPPDGLNSTSIANPIAQPASTTTYTVFATDSIGCKVSGKVEVQVEETAFIPNLFTPNGDGKNDNLLVYGLTQTKDFRLLIFNREGVLVYEASDLLQATSTGWNGYTEGSLQPSGVYYWKIEGTTNNGEQVLLNGRKMGSVLLVH